MKQELHKYRALCTGSAVCSIIFQKYYVLRVVRSLTYEYDEWAILTKANCVGKFLCVIDIVAFQWTLLCARTARSYCCLICCILCIIMLCLFIMYHYHDMSSPSGV